MMRNLYIPVENKKRELQAKVLLACVAAEKGFKPILGVNREIKHNLKVWPPGVITWKGLARKGGKTYKYFHSLGHRVVSWCEEGIVYPSPEFYQRFRVFPEALNEVDMFFAWGKNQADDILFKVPEGKDKVVLAGNPRLDLLSPEFRSVFDKEVAEIKNEFNSFVLVNTNFSAFTHRSGSEVIIENLKKGGRICSAEDEEYFRGRIKNRQELFNYFLEMLKELNKSLDNKAIIVRPHPSEDLELWKASLAGLDNIQVIRQGSAIPWILASELLIHNNCTTGLEAYFLEKPVISYRPTAGNPYESRLLLSVSTCVEDIENLVTTIRQFLGKNYHGDQHDSSETKEILDHYIGNLENELSVDVIFREMLSMVDRNTQANSMPMAVAGFLKRLLSKTTRYVNGIQERKNNDMPETGFCSPKFSGLSTGEVQEIINGLSTGSGRFKGVRLSHVAGTETCIKFDLIK